MKQHILIVVLALSVSVIAEDNWDKLMKELQNNNSSGSTNLKNEIQELRYELRKTQDEIEDLKTSLDYIVYTLYYMNPKASDLAEKMINKIPLNEADKEFIKKLHGWK